MNLTLHETPHEEEVVAVEASVAANGVGMSVRPPGCHKNDCELPDFFLSTSETHKCSIMFWLALQVINMYIFVLIHG